MRYGMMLFLIFGGFACFADTAARMWTSVDGKYSTEAELVGYADGKAQLRKTNGIVIDVPLEKLSAADQRYVKTVTGRAEVPRPSSSGNGLSSLPPAETGSYTASLALKPLNSPSRSSDPGSSLDLLYRMALPQRFSLHFLAERTGPVRSADTDKQTADFHRIVTKEPSYASKHPLRGVARLGSRQYAFAIDTVPEEAAASKPATSKVATTKSAAAKSAAPKSTAPKSAAAHPPLERYARLYFDFNHNGDLTDESVVKAETPRSGPAATASYASTEFPSVRVPIDVAGTKVDYTFRLLVYARTSGELAYVYASLTPAVYREGTISLAGKPMHLVLLDYNSNGRFDDEAAVSANQSASEGRVYPTYGDMLLVEPATGRPIARTSYDPLSGDALHYVSKLIGVDGRFYTLKISPAGDTLTLTPFVQPVGYVTNPNEGFRAMVYGAQGLLKIGDGKSSEVPLPVGDWKLLSYQIRRSQSPPRQNRPTASAGPGQSTASKVQVVAYSTENRSNDEAASVAKQSSVSAAGTSACKSITVRQGEAVVLPFGPPYKPVVKADGLQVGKQARLQMLLVGAGGETCTGLTVEGKRPESPQFTITTTEGKIIQRGKFEFG